MTEQCLFSLNNLFISALQYGSVHLAVHGIGTRPALCCIILKTVLWVH